LQPRHIALAVLLSIFWGLNFVVITIALRDFPPLSLAAVRFAIAAVPILFLPRPPIGWPMLAAIGGTLFVGQFALLFPSMAVGMPPGLASIAIQVQAFITIGIAAAVLRERPTPRQLLGCVVAAAGLGLIASTVGTNGVTLPGLALALGSAIFWSIGNVLLRRAGKVDMLAMVTWMSLIAILPLFLLSVAVEGTPRLVAAVTHVTWLTVGAVLYIAVVSTIFGYAVWGQLLKLYPAATAAPFSLLVPVSGTISAALILGETFGPARLAGMVLILGGLAILVLGPKPARLPLPEPG
jgi:O-acetylserine/cysteine efflux transporter